MNACAVSPGETAGGRRPGRGYPIGGCLHLLAKVDGPGSGVWNDVPVHADDQVGEGVKDGAAGIHADWKIDYGPTDHLLCMV